MKLIILDRDGVINHDSINYIKTPAEWHPIAGSCEAIAKLCDAGYTVCVATNQSGIARGFYDEKTLAAIHEKMQKAVKAAGGEIKLIVYCPHHPDDRCDCRKPKPGMLLKIAELLDTQLDNVPYIGDRKSDYLAAIAVGAKPIMLKSGDPQLTQVDDLPADIYDDLAAAVDAILAS